MSDDRYPLGSEYPSSPPSYPTVQPDPLPSPALPPTAAQPYAASSYRAPQPWPPAPYGPVVPVYATPVAPYGRPAAPGIALTLVITLFFGLFGLIPAFMHSEEAKRNGYPTGKYWATFGITLGAQFVLALMFFLFVIVGFAFLT